MVVIELTLVLLVAPAATAGAICLDKARGTLDHMLATDLSNTEIVLGKLGVRLIPVLGLIACTLPVTALAGLLGGIDPIALAGSFLAAIACAVLGCTLALTLSVWGRKTHEVLMLTYLILVLWLCSPILIMIAAYSFRAAPPVAAAPLIGEYILLSNPYYLAYAPYTDPGKVGIGTFLGFLGAGLVVSGLLIWLATTRIRGVVLAQAGKSAAEPGSRWSRWIPLFRGPRWLPELPGPSLDGNPVLWREWHRSRPSRFLRAAWFLYSGFGVLWILLTLRLAATSGFAEAGAIAAMNVFQVTLGLLLVSVSAATSLAEERARGSLDILLSTPLSTQTILAGKWWGAFREIRHILVWPAVTTGFLLVSSGRILSYFGLLFLISAYGAAITSLGLALATWVSRLGRAVALCVAAYVGFSISWLVVIFVLAMGGGRSNDQTLVPLVMGSPLYGIAFATLAVGPEHHLLPANGTNIWPGTVLWILVHGGTAAALFAITVSSFDHCLGRVSETQGISFDGEKEKLETELEPDY